MLLKHLGGFTTVSLMYQFAVSALGELIYLVFVIYLASLARSELVLVCAMSGIGGYRDEL